jgi:glutamate/tyrosine decarboxylase-like PLP-dependent enzyme
VGYRVRAGGVLGSGGSAANLTAIACAREALLGAMTGDAMLYLSDQTHSSVARAARALGFAPGQVRVIPTDEHQRIRTDALRSALATDRGAGRTPLVVIANAGTTATGAVDPLAELADICRDARVWLHVDGAYGASACLTERGRRALAGLHLADSITIDPHKWLYQPVELGALLVRDGGALRRGFTVAPEYLEGVATEEREVNFSDLGLQLTRSSRALKLWMSVHHFGVAAFRAAIDTCFDLVEHARRRIEETPELELLSAPSLGILTFRRRPAGVDDEAALERINASLADAIAQTGEVFLSTARVRGRFALRLCILNHSTSITEVDRALELAATLPTTDEPVAARVGYPPLEEGWLRRAHLDRDALRALPLFASLDDEQAARVLADARELHTVPSEPIVEQWQVDRDLYVILEGAVEAQVDGTAMRMLGPGDFFGEVAALDWGAGFGRTRTATVTAVEPARLLVLDWQAVARLPPSARQLLERASRERLATQ